MTRGPRTASASIARRVIERFDARMAAALSAKKPKDQLQDLKRQREEISAGKMYYGSNYNAAKSALWYLEGVPGWRFKEEEEPWTSPRNNTYDVKVLVLEAPNHKTFRALEGPSHNSDVAIWLRDETNYIDALDAKIVAITAALRAEAHKKKQGRPVPQGYGTCPCCFGAYKLRRSRGTILMVLHGYERPGYGYIQGRCHGHEFPPFEISKEGTESWVKVIEGILQNSIEALARYKKELKIPRSKIKVVELNRRVVTKPGGGASILQDVFTPEHPDWEKALESRETHLLNEIDSTEQKIEAMKRDIKDLEARIARWKPVEGFVEALG